MKTVALNDFFFLSRPKREKMDVLESSITNFFADEANFVTLRNLLSNKSIQPRLIDYYVTQYSKNNPEFFISSESVEDVYTSYKLQLKGFHKKHFCLFSKMNYISIKCGSAMLALPLAKVNVYKWLISNKIPSLLEEKHASIQKKYYDFRKVSIDKNKKRGKMNTFLKTPTLIKGIKGLKKNVK